MLCVFLIRCSRNWCHSTFNEGRFATFPRSAGAPSGSVFLRVAGKRGCFEAGFDAKFESFFCHEPRSRSPEVAVFFAGSELDAATGTEIVAGAGGSFSDWSGAFFFEELLKVLAELLRERHEQYQSISAAQAQIETDTQTETSALSGSAE